MTLHEGKLICDVCQTNEAVGVAASPLGPISLAYCRQCLSERAESLSIVHATLDCIGGPDNAAPWVKGSIRSYKDGRYIEWEEIVACYVPVPWPDGPAPEENMEQDSSGQASGEGGVQEGKESQANE